MTQATSCTKDRDKDRDLHAPSTWPDFTTTLDAYSTDTIQSNMTQATSDIKLKMTLTILAVL